MTEPLSARASASAPPRLLGLTTAVPPHRLEQADVARLARTVFDVPDSEIEHLLPVFENAGIGARYSCVPLEWYHRPVGWKERNGLYLDAAMDLIEHAAVGCLAEAGRAPGEVDAIVCVSTTGLATPSLEARLMDRVAFREDVQRLPVFGLGCAGGVLGLGRAAALARAMPGAHVLLLVVELCGLTFRPRDHSRANVVATALFGDGAAAALLVADGAGDGPTVTAWGEHRWPESLDVMGWRIEEDGFGVLFSRDIPALVRERFAPALDGFLARHGLSRGELTGYACHPGGAKVVSALEEVLGLAPGAMAEARAVLREYGNMSAASALFVLDRVLAGAPRGPLLVSSLGPGFTAGFAVVEAP